MRICNSKMAAHPKIVAYDTFTADRDGFSLSLAELLRLSSIVCLRRPVADSRAYSIICNTYTTDTSSYKTGRQINSLHFQWMRYLLPKNYLH